MKNKTCSTDLYTPEYYQMQLEHLKSIHHSQCVFNRKPPVASLIFKFVEGGVLSGEFTCTEEHQGYDAMVHGGILSAIADASMAQCLMGHGVVGYTTDLSIKYRKPVLINLPTRVETVIEETSIRKLFQLRCIMTQSKCRAVEATGRFFKIK